MMMPSIFGENLFDDFMNDFTFPNISGCRQRTVWKTCKES